ncbi:MAG: hypothetical protein V3S69_04040 [Dehalococcoidales bacterium]
MSVDFRLLDSNYLFESQTDITSSGVDASFPLSNLKHSFRSKVARLTPVAAENWVTADLKTTEEIDSFVMVWPALDLSKLSNAATIKLQANATDVWTSPALSVDITYDEQHNMASHYFTADESYRFWRVLISDPLNPYGYIEVPKIWLGKAVTMQSPDIGFSAKKSDQSKVTRTEFGQQYSDINPIMKTFEFNWSVMDETDRDKLDEVFQRVGNTGPVFMSLDSAAELFNNKDKFSVYGTISGDLSSKHRQSIYFDPALTIVETM